MNAQIREDRESMFDIATTMRSKLVELLDFSINTKQTQGACMYGCVLLKSAFDHFTDFKAEFRGGDGVLAGFKDDHSHMHGHYWLAVTSTTGTYIVDITSDQFGYPSVIIEEECNSMAYIPGDQATIDDHFNEFRLTISNGSA